jgi:hypothetical protein
VHPAPPDPALVADLAPGEIADEEEEERVASAALASAALRNARRREPPSRFWLFALDVPGPAMVRTGSAQGKTRGLEPCGIMAVA